VTKATSLPDADGHFGQFGGRFVSETLFAALDDLRDTYDRLWQSPDFQAEFDLDMAHYVGRPSPLYYAKRLTEAYGGAKIYLKRED
jgi:tryptophan synthase beta chain